MNICPTRARARSARNRAAAFLAGCSAFALLAATSEARAVEDGILDNAYFSIYAAAALPRISSVENTSTGTLAGYTVITEETMDGVVFSPSAIVGYNFKNLGLPFRLEAEYTIRGKTEYREEPVFSGNGLDNSTLQGVVENQTFLANFMYDINIGSKRWTPFIGAGVGVSWNNGEAYQLTPNSTGAYERVNNVSTELAWSLMGGVSLAFGTDWSFDTRYRYVDMGKVSWGPTETLGGSTWAMGLEGDFSTHEFAMGFRYQF